MSKILLYEENSTGVTTNETQYAFYINENGLPTVKNGSEVITFGTSGYAFAGSSGSSGANGSSGQSGTAGVSGTSGQDGAPGATGATGSSGSSGASGTNGINGIDGANGSSGATGSAGTSGLSYGSSGTSGLSYGSSGTSGASLAAITEDAAYTSGSYVYTNNAGVVDSWIYPVTDNTVNWSTEGNGFNSATDSFTGYTNTYAVAQNIQTFINSKKLKSININRTANYTGAPTGKTECVTVSAYLKIYKGTINTSGAFSYALAKTIDLNGLINFNVSGSTTTVNIDLSADNIQTAYNEYIYAQIDRTTEVCNSTSKLINIPGINLYFETVASGILGSNGTAGSSGVSGSAGSSGLSFGSSGTSGNTGSSGSSGQTGSSGSSGGPGATGSSGSSGASGSSGTSAGGGGAINSKNYEIMNVDLISGTTVNGGWEYLGGMFGITSHWGYDSSRNYEFGATYPVNIAVGKTLKDVIFPIQIDAAGSVPYKIVIWGKQAGTYYPGAKITVDEFNITGETGYNVVEYNVDFLNDGSYQSSDLFFISIWRYDSAGDKHRFRASVNTYQDVGYMGIFNPSTKDFASGFQHSMTTIFNSSWNSGGVPSTYGTGSSGSIFFGGAIPCFWRIA